MAKIPVIVIFAPTASGKTALMYELFSCEGSQFFLNGKAEIISADSMQVYKKLDIGTAKPDAEFCKKIPHHLIDLVDCKTQVSVADFVTQADERARDIYVRRKFPVVAGGTGFYIRSFLTGLPKTPESDVKIRDELKARLEKEGKESLYKELCEKDMKSAKVINQNDCYRILRALEIFYTTGKPRSSYELEKSFRCDFNFLPIILEPPRDLLFKRIDERVDQMFEMGLAEEVRGLILDGAKKSDPGMQAIGYREFFMCEEWINEFACQNRKREIQTAFSDRENVLLEKIRNMIKHDTKKYAKKQYTYIRDLPIPAESIIPYTASREDVEKVKEVISHFPFMR